MTTTQNLTTIQQSQISQISELTIENSKSKNFQNDDLLEEFKESATLPLKHHTTEAEGSPTPSNQNTNPTNPLNQTSPHKPSSTNTKLDRRLKRNSKKGKKSKKPPIPYNSAPVKPKPKRSTKPLSKFTTDSKIEMPSPDFGLPSLTNLKSLNSVTCPVNNHSFGFGGVVGSVRELEGSCSIIEMEGKFESDGNYNGNCADAAGVLPGQPSCGGESYGSKGAISPSILSKEMMQFQEKRESFAKNLYPNSTTSIPDLIAQNSPESYGNQPKMFCDCKQVLVVDDNIMGISVAVAMCKAFQIFAETVFFLNIDFFIILGY